MSNIPKVINYCWFGGNKKSKLIEKCIKSWKKYCPDYEIVEWNESNFDININRYVREAYENKKWAFVSDFARLYVIYQNGGIYLDTDVELIKSLDEMLEYNLFLASENNVLINTGLGFGASKNNKVIKKLIDSYNNIPFMNPDSKELDLTPCTDRNTETLNEIYGNVSELLGKELNNKSIILGKEYFCPFNAVTGKMQKTENTFGIHWFNASWRNKNINIREKLLRPIKRLIGEDNFKKMKRKK